MELTFDRREDIVVMTLSGPVSRDDVQHARAEASKLQRDTNAQRYLVDLRSAQIDMSTLEIFTFCASIKDEFAPGTRHAVLYSAESLDLSDVAFGENVGSNYGILLKMFTRTDDAKAWLLSP